MYSHTHIFPILQQNNLNTDNCTFTKQDLFDYYIKLEESIVQNKILDHVTSTIAPLNLILYNRF